MWKSILVCCDSSEGANKNNIDGTRWIHIAFQVLNHFETVESSKRTTGGCRKRSGECNRGHEGLGPNRWAAGTGPTWDCLLRVTLRGGLPCLFTHRDFMGFYTIFMSDFWMFQDLKYCIPVAGRFSTNHMYWNCVLCGLPGSSWGWLLKSLCCNRSWQGRRHNDLPEDVLWKACLTHCLVLQCCFLGYDL